MIFTYPKKDGTLGEINAQPYYVLRNLELDSNKFSWWSTQPLGRTPAVKAGQSDPERLNAEQTALIHRVNSEPARRWLIHDTNGWIYYTVPQEDVALYRKIVRKPNGKIDVERSKMWPKSYLRATMLDWPHVALGSDGRPGGKNNFLLAEEVGSVYRVFGIPDDCDLDKITPQSHPFWFHRALVWYGNLEKGRFGYPSCGDAWEAIFGNWYIRENALAPCAPEEMYAPPPVEDKVFVKPLRKIMQGPSYNSTKIRRVGVLGFWAVIIEDRGDWVRIPEGWVER